MLRTRAVHAGTAVAATALALVAAGLAASPAQAQTTATVSADWDRQAVRYVAGEGQVNNLYVTFMGPGTTEGTRRVGFNDEVPIAAGDHCSYLDPSDDTFVVCELPEDTDRPDDVDIHLGDGDDDIFTSDPGVDTVHGGAGDDTMHAHSARTVLGGAGDDMVMGGLMMDGGPGMDHVMGDDRDQLLLGGPGADMIEAMGGADAVFAGSGDDMVEGGAGDDALFGERGADMLHGGEGDDALFGGRGDDMLAGGAGEDVLVGGPGADQETQDEMPDEM